MPICDNNNKNNPITVAADIDHADAEIAKVKISREQAYFNSYDFDAIEVLPLDETDEAEEADRESDSRSHSSNRQQLTDIEDDINNRGDGDVDVNVEHHQVPSGAYLKRLTSYFSAATTLARSSPTLRPLKGQATVLTQSTTSDSPSSEDSSENQSEGSHLSRGSTRKLYSGDGDDVNCGPRNSFSLPRAMLKCPSTLAVNSMSVANTVSAVVPDKMCNLSGVYSGQNGAVQRCEKSDARSRERVVSSSHYSTEKSGSSGYYSSRVCSTSSVEEHIYSEPVVDIIHARLAPSVKQMTLPLQKTTEIHQIHDPNLKSQTGDNYYNIRPDGDVRITDELRCLENSIKSLDRHLKTYSESNGVPFNRLGERSSPGSSECLVYDEASLASVYDKLKNAGPMPTIMEGTDGAHSSLKTRPSWSEDIDDSLMDIDLDSFRLVDEVSRNGPRKANNVKKLTGIDNPSFSKTKVLQEEVLENNYKCSKYVNSCPENAYIVESITESLATQDIAGSQAGSGRRTLGFYLKRYEDQLHFQSTKDMLEDIQTKVNALTTSSTRASNTNSGESQKIGSHLHLNSTAPIPKDLERYIVILKQELETYLSLMNHCNELEIKQFCTGLVNDQKLLTITKAFERRRSLASDNSFSLSYEPLRPSNHTPLPYTHNNERIIDDDATIVSSDPNFHMKRKSKTLDNDTISRQSYSSLRHSRSIVESTTEESRLAVGGNSTLKVATNSTQLQKNLSLQRPMLDRRNTKLNGEDIVNDKDLMLEWHKNKPSIWEQYYGTNRINQTLTGKRGQLVKNGSSVLSYPSSRPESDFTLDLPRAEQLRIKMDKEKKFRQRCRILTTFLSLVFFLLTVMVVSLILTRGKRMFGSML